MKRNRGTSTRRRGVMRHLSKGLSLVQHDAERRSTSCCTNERPFERCLMTPRRLVLVPLFLFISAHASAQQRDTTAQLAEIGRASCRERADAPACEGA